ncbi:MAG: LamG-like jellyroll fold domain-containing protein [Bdellovibrionia bacterium]
MIQKQLLLFFTFLVVLGCGAPKVEKKTNTSPSDGSEITNPPQTNEPPEASPLPEQPPEESEPLPQPELPPEGSNPPAPTEPPNPTPTPTRLPQVVITEPLSKDVLNNKNEFKILGQCQTGATVILTGDSSEQVECFGQTFSFTIAATQSKQHQFQIVQQTSSIDTSDVVNLKWTTDFVAPDKVKILQPSSSSVISNDASLRIEGECEESAKIELTGPQTLSSVCSSQKFNFNLVPTSDGSYDILIKQVDAAGNVSAPTTLSWTRDTVKPVITLLQAPPLLNFKNKGTFEFAVDEAQVQVQCLLNGQILNPCVSPLSLKDLKNGDYVLEIEATDSVGNKSQTLFYRWQQIFYNTVALYHLNDTDTTRDFSFYTSQANLKNNLEVLGAPSFNLSGKFPSSKPYSVSFGIDNILQTPDHSLFSTLDTTISIEGFFRISASPGAEGDYYTLISKTGLAGDHGWSLRLKRTKGNAKHVIEFVCSSDGKILDIAAASSSLTVQNNTWYFYGITWQQGEAKFYFGASSAGLINTVGTIDPKLKLNNSAAPMRLGSEATTGQGQAKWLLGSLDEIKVSQIVRVPTLPKSEFVAD